MASNTVWSPIEFSFDDLHNFTDGFSKENFIAETQYGKVYHGKIDNKMVMVKIWVAYEEYFVKEEDQIVRANEEVRLLQQQNIRSHPNIVKMIGHCTKGEQLGVVYDLHAKDTILNLVFEESFTWMHRIKAAIEFAWLINFLHNKQKKTPGYLVRNIGPAHIIIGQDFSPRMFDFGMLSGGILPDKRKIKGVRDMGYAGYIDMRNAYFGNWIDECDIFSLGCVLIGLFFKKVYTTKGLWVEDNEELEPYFWAQDNYSPPYDIMKGFGQVNRSLVDESLKGDRGFCESDAIKITRIVLGCVEHLHHFRPSMDEVLRSLLKLRVVKQYTRELGLKHILRGEYFMGISKPGDLKYIFRKNFCSRLSLCSR